MLTVLLSAACTGKSEPLGPTATVPHATTTTNPYAVPAVIDEAYVNRVLAGLDHAVGDVVRLIVDTKTIPPEAIERLKTLYVGDALQLAVDLFQDDMFNSFRGYKEHPGDGATTVTRLITVRPNCVFAEVYKDFSAVGTNPDPAFSTQWIALVPYPMDSKGINPTGWAFSYEGFQRDFSQPEDQCGES